MSDTKRDPTPKTSANFTSWKLRLMKAAGADPRIPPTYFRFLVRVVEALNEQTRIAMIGDDVIADEVPGFAQQSTRNRARRALAELGYLTYEAGQGSKVTRYRISDEPVPAIMVAIDQARTRRALEREARRQAFRDQSKPAPVQGTNGVQPCKSHLAKPAPMQGVHLQDTPSLMGYRGQDETQDAHAPAPMPARAFPPPPDDDDWDDEPARKSEAETLRAEFEARELPRSESGGFICFDCEAETELAARYKSEPYCPFCRDCIVEGEFPDVKQFAAPMSYAEASRGR